MIPSISILLFTKKSYHEETSEFAFYLEQLITELYLETGCKNINIMNLAYIGKNFRIGRNYNVPKQLLRGIPGDLIILANYFKTTCQGIQFKKNCSQITLLVILGPLVLRSI